MVTKLQNKTMVVITAVAALTTIVFQLPQNMAIASSAYDDDHHHQHYKTTSPYVEGKYTIKSLTDKDLRSLQNGTGEAFGGMAKLAELNAYPGPRHVLDMASDLNLTLEQKEKIEDIYHNMSSRAKEIGLGIIAIEKQMDDSFANKTLSAEELKCMLDQSARYYSQLRYVHLSAHIDTASVLTADQINTYNKLRGYN